MKEKLIIIGTSTNAKHVYEFVKDYDLYDIKGFAVNKKYLTNTEFMGLPVYAIEELDKVADKSKVKLFVALLWNRLNADRKKLYLELKEQGYSFANLISPKASIRGKLSGDNCWIHDFVTIQNDSCIGNNVAMMAYSLVGTGSTIGDHCFMGAKSTVAGGCSIGEQTFIGLSATVFDATTVGKKCILGACTAVKRNVPDYSLYKTSSDMVIKEYDENTIEEKLMFSKNKR